MTEVYIVLAIVLIVISWAIDSVRMSRLEEKSEELENFYNHLMDVINHNTQLTVENFKKLGAFPENSVEDMIVSKEDPHDKA